MWIEPGGEHPMSVAMRAARKSGTRKIVGNQPADAGSLDLSWWLGSWNEQRRQPREADGASVQGGYCLVGSGQVSHYSR